MYYAIITCSVILFGIQFLFNNKFQKECGSTIGATFIFTLLSSITGLLFLLIINKLQFGFTPFTLLMAVISSITMIAYNFCSLKAFNHINLSLFSLFAMLGGMVLPFVTGIIFYNEPLTLGNSLCLIAITLALIITIEKGEKKKGTIYYAGVFILNGMFGVLSKIYAEAQLEKCNEAVYSIWIALVTSVMAGIILIFLRKSLPKLSLKGFIYTAGYGAINKTANYLLLLSLAVLPASVQYPFVTGGTMIISTIISALCKQKPTKKELIAVGLSFTGILLLVII